MDVYEDLGELEISIAQFVIVILLHKRTTFRLHLYGVTWKLYANKNVQLSSYTCTVSLESCTFGSEWFLKFLHCIPNQFLEIALNNEQGICIIKSLYFFYHTWSSLIVTINFISYQSKVSWTLQIYCKYSLYHAVHCIKIWYKMILPDNNWYCYWITIT